MIYHKLLILSNRFRNKYAGIKEKLYLENLTSKFRPIMNEMEGDIMTLKIMSFDHNSLKLFNSIYRDILHLFKNINDSNYDQSLKALFDFVNSKQMRAVLKQLQIKIDQFILDNTIDFSGYKRFTMVKIQSIKKLILTLEDIASYSFDEPQGSMEEDILDKNLDTKITKI